MAVLSHCCLFRWDVNVEVCEAYDSDNDDCDDSDDESSSDENDTS